jgi:hypothetical protein
MAGFAFAWSLVSLLTFLAHDYTSMMVLRFILGIVEAPVSLAPEFLVASGQHC